MSDSKNKNLIKPYRKFAKKVLDTICDGFGTTCKPWKCICGDNAGIIFCGCCICILPIMLVHGLIIASIFMAVLLVFTGIGVFLGLCCVMIGIWPAFITSVGITGITIIRIPFNIYYTFKVLYYSACIRPGLKCVVAIVTVPLLSVIPIFTLITVGTISFSAYFGVSFCGWALRPWIETPTRFKWFWKKYVTDAKVTDV